MNVLLPTPAELIEFQISHYTNLMETSRSFEHKIFLRKQIFNLKNQLHDVINSNANDNLNPGIHRCCNGNMRHRINDYILHGL